MFLSLIAALTYAVCAAEQPPVRRGAFAFYYGPPLSAEALRWYARFELLVTHDPLPAAQVDALHRAGTRLLLYEWSVAFYESRATEWQASLRGSKAVLHARPLTGGAGSATAPAWYFDPAWRGHAQQRARDLSRRLRETGYDGFFFDTTTVANVHAQARQEYERRHPAVPYDRAFSRFLAELRRRQPGAILFTNQGYRQAQDYLPHVDWDLSESLITRPDRGGFRLRRWRSEDDPWNSIHFVFQRHIEPLTEQYPHVRFGHLNYVSGDDRQAIPLVTAVAQLFGGEGYVSGAAVADEADPIYFRDPGKPLSTRVDLPGGKASYRLYEHGVIAVNEGAELTIELPEHGAWMDRATGALHCGRRLTIPAAERARAHFFDRAALCHCR